MEYADLVRNLVVTVKFWVIKHHIMNPQLLKELASKLSTNLKISWGMFASETEESHISIENFSNWLKKIANAMSILSSVHGNLLIQIRKELCFTSRKKKVTPAPVFVYFARKVVAV